MSGNTFYASLEDQFPSYFRVKEKLDENSILRDRERI